MKELVEYREKLVSRFRETAWEFSAACEAVSAPFAKTEDGWTLHQIASHTRDVQKLVYRARIERILLENKPLLDGFDADEWMAVHYNQQEPLSKILQELMQDVDELSAILSAAPREIWSRESRHPQLGGGLTLQFWVERSLAHIKEHLTVVKRLKAD